MCCLTSGSGALCHPFSVAEVTVKSIPRTPFFTITLSLSWADRYWRHDFEKILSGECRLSEKLCFVLLEERDLDREAWSSACADAAVCEESWNGWGEEGF